jgi:NDP-sugar pyrophosphorylase family protein
LNNSKNNSEHVTTALLLAAGTGSRLSPLTKKAPKCLTMVNGVSILGRLTSCLNQQGFKRLVVVTGHLENQIREFLGTRVGNMKIDYIFSPLYATTNNIYSLWMARKIINEPFLLVESDLVFDESLLKDMLYPDRIAVARMQPWMNGTTVTANPFKQVEKFRDGNAGPSDEIRYKTVNIYSFSLSSWQRIKKRLDQHISTGRVNSYYETVFAEMVADGSLSLRTVSFDGKPWYEIDTIEDLAETEKLFAADRYETTIPYTITPRTAEIPKSFLQQPKSKASEMIIHSFSGSKPEFLNKKPIHGPEILVKESAFRDKTPGTTHDAA